MQLKPMAWDFHNPTAIVFGGEFIEQIERHVPNRKTLLFTSKGSTRRGVTSKILQVRNCLVIDDAPANPGFEDLKRLHTICEEFRPEQILAVGGGSVIDIAKVFSYILGSRCSSESLIDSLVKGAPLKVATNLPLIAVPTTSGTGSEVTPFATVWDKENRKKYSVATANLHPTKALLIPELTLSLPWDVTLATGMDALTQALESVWNKNRNTLTLSLATTAVDKTMHALPLLKKNLADLEARSMLLEGSLLAGLCISKTRTAMSHAASYPLTAHFETPHGVACGFTIVDMWDYNLPADNGPMRELSLAMGVAPEKFSHHLLSFMQSLDFGTEFKKTITSSESVLVLTPEMFTPGRADNTIRPFTNESLVELLEQALERWL